MGVKKFSSGFIHNLPDIMEHVQNHAKAIYIDGNQFLYKIMPHLHELCREEDTENGKRQCYNSDIDFNRHLIDSIKKVVKHIEEELSKYSKLEVIYFCMDGIPCVGKVCNQFIRRKNNPITMGKKDENRIYDTTGESIIFNSTLFFPRSYVNTVFCSSIKEMLIGFKKFVDEKHKKHWKEQYEKRQMENLDKQLEKEYNKDKAKWINLTDENLKKYREKYRKQWIEQRDIEWREEYYRHDDKWRREHKATWEEEHMPSWTESVRSNVKQMAVFSSLHDIHGEGEHKMMDFLRHCPYANNDEEVLVWSDDSDVPLMLISHPSTNINVRASVTLPKAKQNINQHLLAGQAPPLPANKDKHYSLVQLKLNLCRNPMEILNLNPIFMFMGNDYLPEMPNTRRRENYSMPDDYAYYRKISTKPLVEFARSNEANAEANTVPMESMEYLRFNVDNLLSLVSVITSREIELYYSVEQFKQLLRADISKNDPVQFKRKYYETILSRFTDKELTVEIIAKFEVLMAVSYLKTYVWYHLYMNGYVLAQNHVDHMYEFTYPPLYNSLKLVLMEMKLGKHKELNDLFTARYARRSPDYFSRLSRDVLLGYQTTISHMGCVLQLPDIALELGLWVHRIASSDEASSRTRSEFTASLEALIEFRENMPKDLIAIFEATELRDSFILTRLNRYISYYPIFDIKEMASMINKALGIDPLGIDSRSNRVIGYTKIGELAFGRYYQRGNPNYQLEKNLF